MSSNWEWYGGLSNNKYEIGPCNSKEEVIKEMIFNNYYTENEQGISFYIIEATTPTLADIEIQCGDTENNISLYFHDARNEEYVTLPLSRKNQSN